MRMRGNLKGVNKDYMTGRWSLTFELTEVNIIEVQNIKEKDLDIEAKQHHEHRKLNANRMLWACLGELAAAFQADKWEMYLQALRNYGQYTLLEIEPAAFPKLKEMWRECEEVGTRTAGGKELKQVLCYFGSSTYNTKEFAHLLDGVIQDMKDAGLETPTSQEMKRALEELEREEAQKQAANG